MVIAEIGAATTPANPDIRRRMASSTKARSTKHYVANHDGVEVGFVAVDAIPEADYLVLYELFVIERFRGSGLGALLLAEVERFANILGYERVILFPNRSNRHFRPSASWPGISETATRSVPTVRQNLKKLCEAD